MTMTATTSSAATTTTMLEPPTSKQKAKLLLKMANAVEDSSAQRRRQQQRTHKKSLDAETIDQLLCDLERQVTGKHHHRPKGGDHGTVTTTTAFSLESSSPKSPCGIDPQQMHLLYNAMIRYRENSELRYQLLELKHLDLSRSFVELENRYRHLEREQEAWKKSCQTLQQAVTTTENTNGGGLVSSVSGKQPGTTRPASSFNTSTVPRLQQELKLLSSQRNQLLQANLELRKQLKQMQIQMQTPKAENSMTATCRRCHPELLAGRQQFAEDAFGSVVEQFHSSTVSLGGVSEHKKSSSHDVRNSGSSHHKRNSSSSHHKRNSSSSHHKRNSSSNHNRSSSHHGRTSSNHQSDHNNNLMDNSYNHCSHTSFAEEELLIKEDVVVLEEDDEIESLDGSPEDDDCINDDDDIIEYDAEKEESRHQDKMSLLGVQHSSHHRREPVMQYGGSYHQRAESSSSHHQRAASSSSHHQRAASSHQRAARSHHQRAASSHYQRAASSHHQREEQQEVVRQRSIVWTPPAHAAAGTGGQGSRSSSISPTPPPTIGRTSAPAMQPILPLQTQQTTPPRKTPQPQDVQVSPRRHTAPVGRNGLHPASQIIRQLTLEQEELQPSGKQQRPDSQATPIMSNKTTACKRKTLNNKNGNHHPMSPGSSNNKTDGTMDRFGSLFDEYGRSISYRTNKCKGSAATVATSHAITPPRHRRKSSTVPSSPQQQIPPRQRSKNQRHSLASAPPNARHLEYHPPGNTTKQHQQNPLLTTMNARHLEFSASATPGSPTPRMNPPTRQYHHHGPGSPAATRHSHHPGRTNQGGPRHLRHQPRPGAPTAAARQNAGAGVLSRAGANAASSGALSGMAQQQRVVSQQQQHALRAKSQEEPKQERPSRPQSYFERIRKTLQQEI